MDREEVKRMVTGISEAMDRLKIVIAKDITEEDVVNSVKNILGITEKHTVVDCIPDGFVPGDFIYKAISEKPVIIRGTLTVLYQEDKTFIILPYVEYTQKDGDIHMARTKFRNIVINKNSILYTVWFNRYDDTYHFEVREILRKDNKICWSMYR